MGMRVQIKNIICTTDFSDISDHAIPYGIALSKEFASKLYLCHAIDLTSIAMYGEAVVALQEQENRMTEYAQERLNALIGDKVEGWEPLITAGPTADEIVRVSFEKQADLVVSSTHGRSGLKRLILGSVTERLMRTLPCPLLVIPSPERDIVGMPPKGIQFKRILVGCDFSSDSGLALEFALSLAQEFQADLNLVHVLQPSTYEDLLKTSAETSAQEQDLRLQLNEQLNALVPEEALNWCNPQTSLLAGQPSEEIIKYAVLNNVDLIVLGIRGHGLVESILVGSTTERVARQAPCAVLSVRPVVQYEA